MTGKRFNRHLAVVSVVIAASLATPSARAAIAPATSPVVKPPAAVGGAPSGRTPAQIGPLRPDLVVDRVWPPPALARAGESFSAKATVKNVGLLLALHRT